MAESLVNETMDAHVSEACARGNQHNGYRERKLITSDGTNILRIPKLRAGGYLPEDLIERYSRVDRAVITAVSKMVTNGVSTRKVKRAAQTMGINRMSASQVSRICSSLDESVAALQERDCRTSPALTSGSTRPTSSAGMEPACRRPRWSLSSASARAGTCAFWGSTSSTPSPTTAESRSRAAARTRGRRRDLRHQRRP